MAKFTVTIDVETHVHSPTAHRHLIGTLLDQVKQAIGGGVLNEGEIITPAAGIVPERVVGSWQISDDQGSQEPWDVLTSALAGA